MSKKEKIKGGSHLALADKTGENKELDHLPSQKPEDVCLYNTDTKALVEVPGMETYRDGLAKLKTKFLWEIQELSKRFEVNTDVRVYFEIKPEG